MRRIEGFNPASLNDALAAKSKLGELGRYIAGGTDVMVDLRGESGSLPPLQLIDLSHLDELKGIVVNRSVVSVGALVTHSELVQSADLMKCAPLLSAASAEVGSPQIRSRGTIGGNICNASPCADTMPALVALNAQLILQSSDGERAIDIAEMLVAPYKTTLNPNELLTKIQFNALGENAHCAFVKLGRRLALSVSRMSVAVVFDLDSSGQMTGVRVAAGSVAPIVKRFTAVEDLLSAQIPSEELFAEAGRVLAAEMIGISGRRWSTPYKEPVAEALMARALRTALSNLVGTNTNEGIEPAW